MAPIDLLAHALTRRLPAQWRRLMLGPGKCVVSVKSIGHG
jgi:hypothetical protein